MNLAISNLPGVVNAAGQGAAASIGAAISEVQSTVAVFKETLSTVQATADRVDEMAKSLSTPPQKKSSRRRQPIEDGEYFGDTDEDKVRKPKARAPKSPKVNRFHVCLIYIVLPHQLTVF